MNQKQRDFLVERVDRIWKREVEAHDKTRPDKPSLSNHLVAAILEGKAVMKSSDALREIIRNRVIKLGKGEALLVEGSGRKSSWKSRYDDGEDDSDHIEILALDLYEMPEGYSKEIERFKKEMDAWTKKRKVIGEMHDSLIMKIQIGSDKVLDSLIMEADNIGELSLMNAQLTMTVSKQLGEEKPIKQLKS